MKKVSLLVVLVALTLTLDGCGGNGSNNSNPPGTVTTIAVSLSSPSIAVGATEQLSATAKDSSGNTVSGVTFTWSSTSTGVATVNSTGLVSAVSAGTSQITASASGVTSTAVTVTVTPPVIATITVSPSLPSLPVGAKQQFSATAKDSNGNPINGVSFTWASTATNVATIDPTGLATGLTTGTTQITASANAVTSSGDTLTVTKFSACASGSESLLNGGYVFLLTGFDGSGNPALVIGELTFDGTGTMTAGTIDENLDSGVESNVAVIAGAYAVGSDQRGCLVVITAGGTENYRFSLGNISAGVAATGHMIDFDSTGPFTAGMLRQQSGGPFSNSSATGSYAFLGSSPQNSAVCASPCNAAVIGVINLDGSGGVSGGSEDFDQKGTLDGNAANTTWPASPIPIDSGGTYSVSANGRATLAFSVGGGSSSLSTVLYLVSSSKGIFMSANPQTGGTVLAGTTLLQSGAPFAGTPLSGTYIGYDSGNAITGVGRTDLTLLGPLTAGNNAVTGTSFRNNGGTFSSTGLAGSTYAVSTAGRMIISGGGGNQPVLYLANTGQAFYLDGNVSVDSGFFQLQSGSPFSNSSASGTYALGEVDPALVSAGVISGVATFAPATTSINVTIDENGSGGSPTAGVTQSLTYSIDSTGLGLIPSGCSITATPITCNTMFYVVSPTTAVVMDPQASSPQVQTADQ